MKPGDTLLVGPYSYKVMHVAGNYVTFSFKRGAQEFSVVVKMRQFPAVSQIKAA